MKAVNIDEKGWIYGRWEVMENTWEIQDRHGVGAYLLIGEEKAMLIDTMYGDGDLRALIEEITDRPVMVCNTHGHIDHTGGNGFWEDAYMSEESTRDCKVAFGEEMQKRFDALPHPDYRTHVLEDGQIIDLGGRKVLCIRIGAHHPGSMAYLDLSTGALFPGDEMEAGQVLLFLSELDWKDTVAKHLENMEKLAAHGDKIKSIWPAHNGSPLTPRYLYDYIELDKRILAGTAEEQPDLAGYNMGPDSSGLESFFKCRVVRYRYGEASIVVKQQ